MAGSAETDPTVERVARAMATADGKNPDGQVETGKMVSEWISRSTLEHRPETRPMWHDYVAEARRFIAAHAALVDKA